MPLTDAEQEWLKKQSHAVVSVYSEIPGLKRAEPRGNCCKTCKHFYRHDYSPQRYTYCRLFPSKHQTSYGHCKTTPTKVCPSWEKRTVGDVADQWAKSSNE
jgi:hypothetical protein